LHHPVQRAGFDLFLEPDVLVGLPAGLAREPVPETNAREVIMGKPHRNATPGTASGHEHFGVRDVINERIRLQRRQRIPGLRAAADCLNSRLIEPCPAASAKELAGFGVITLGQHARLADAHRHPALTESTSNRIPLKLKIAFRVLGHDENPSA